MVRQEGEGSRQKLQLEVKEQLDDEGPEWNLLNDLHLNGGRVSSRNNEASHLFSFQFILRLDLDDQQEQVKGAQIVLFFTCETDVPVQSAE